MTPPLRISSRDNPLVAKLRRLARNGSAFRKLGFVWLEGEHLCTAALAQGRLPEQAVVSETSWNMPRLRTIAQAAPRVAIATDALFAQISGLESPAAIGFVLGMPEAAPLDPAAPSVVLDRIQDAGNVGSILRSAAAFGFAQILALQGTASLWSPKVLRAGMGAHFGLRLLEGLAPEALDALRIPLIATSSHADSSLADAPLPQPCAWVFGHEGQGVAADVLGRCRSTLRIPQPGGEESLNVAAAAAVCLYESGRRARL